MNNYLKISETVWLVIALLTVVIVVYFVATEGFEENYKLLFLPLVAGAMWMFRRIQRTKSEKQNPPEK